MGAGKFGLSAAGTQKATAETLKGLEGEFMKAAMERGSAGYKSSYAENAVELPNGAGAILGKASIAKGQGQPADVVSNECGHIRLRRSWLHPGEL